MINVFFDMDGTLIDSSNAIAMAVNEIRTDNKLPALSKAEIYGIINTPGIDWAKELYDANDFTHKSFKQGFERYFVKHYEQSVVLFEGVMDVLKFLRGKNCYLAIATNAPQSSLKRILNKYNILPFFDKVVGVSENMEPKPHPMMLNLLHEEAIFEKSIFVGDSLKDRECAMNANIPYYHAKWYQNELKDNEFNNAQMLIEFLQTHL
ncbi:MULTISPECIES: HAD family hydrolase [unclassified Campylobacter]|uniref:HAD family hydrolase n=1 Tax=unclassified Campylobacter TaxID=2593542 RepID=UPI001237E449|nr:MULTISPECIES: HAD family hydrolase [unclassified Campylobacter]KAA6225489.1 HAD family hydrolase [Campylobacter sp. LR196d]KAA6227427.1 HAD family hydrolase [Campylobacter sp. LR185c]KAA6229760.1 HAD family hydrolase [Campylobacter sp. LR286c]KAA6234285.1 HAD family hydrolase [Campylobacter sp. LR291e]KAA8604105.1 HAD family hydrolase [Campylobacter sp. LR185c]